MSKLLEEIRSYLQLQIVCKLLVLIIYIYNCLIFRGFDRVKHRKLWSASEERAQRCTENKAIREELQIFDLYKKLKDYKQRWKEHLERMSDSRLSKQVWKYKRTGHRCVGRPTKWWLEDFWRRNRQHLGPVSYTHLFFRKEN